MFLEFGDKLLVVDCGVLFPEESQPGVDLILLIFRGLKTVLTTSSAWTRLSWAPKPHRGGSMLKLREDIPIYGSDLTLAFVEPGSVSIDFLPKTFTVVEENHKRLVPSIASSLRIYPLDSRRATVFVPCR